MVGATETLVGGAFEDVSVMVLDSTVSSLHATRTSDVPSKTSNRDDTNLLGIMTLETASV